MKKIKDLSIRLLYRFYLAWFKIKYPRIIADGKYRPTTPLRFNEWVYEKGFFPKDHFLLKNNLIRELNIIVPKGYADLVKKYPDFKPFTYPTLEKKSGETFFKWYETK